MTPTQMNERSREIRLWIGQIVLPSVIALGGVLSIPEVRETISEKMRDVKFKIQEKRSKKRA